MASNSNKEPIEIKCSNCSSEFRLWIPADLLPKWDEGEELNCIKCGTRFQIKKGKKGYEVTLVATATEATLTAEAEAGKAAVLFVEDDPLATAIAENTLVNAGIHLVTAKSGEEGLDKIKNEKFNIIVTDLHLIDPDNPETKIDGEDLLRQAADNGSRIPAIVTTGKDIIDDIALDPKWFDLNVKGFIQKGNPFWAEELKDKIKEVLALA